MTPPAEQVKQGGWRRRRWSRPLSTTFRAAVESYLRAKPLSRGTRNEYRSTVRKWEQWGGGPPIEALQHKEIREFLDWVHERALAEEGTNPGRTTNKAREHLRAVLSWAWEQELIEAPPRLPGPSPAFRRSAAPFRTACSLLNRRTIYSPARAGFQVGGP